MKSGMNQKTLLVKQSKDNMEITRDEIEEEILSE